MNSAQNTMRLIFAEMEERLRTDMGARVTRLIEGGADEATVQLVLAELIQSVTLLTEPFNEMK